MLLMELCNTDNQSLFAKYADIEASYVSQILHETRTKLSRRTSDKISKRLQIPFEWIYEGKGSPPKRVRIPGSAEDDDTELAEVHIVNNGLGGEGGYDVYEQVPIEQQVPLKTIKLPKELVGDCRQAIEVRGDSMFPTLKDGDFVGVDTKDKALVPGELYLIRSRYFGLIVKRLEDADPGIMVKSDNPTASSRIVPEDRLEEEVNVIGRIAWIFGTRKSTKKG